MTRQDFAALLYALEAQLPSLMAANAAPGNFLAEFAGQVDVIADQAREHGAMVKERIRATLAEHGRDVVEVDESP